jgi:hypothetical protein
LRKRPYGRRWTAKRRFARRLLRDLAVSAPGGLVHLDTFFVNLTPTKAIKPFTAYGPIAKWTVGKAFNRATAQAAASFLDTPASVSARRGGRDQPAPGGPVSSAFAATGTRTAPWPSAAADSMTVKPFSAARSAAGRGSARSDTACAGRPRRRQYRSRGVLFQNSRERLQQRSHSKAGAIERLKCWPQLVHFISSVSLTLLSPTTSS